VGETQHQAPHHPRQAPFSILERIDVGETLVCFFGGVLPKYTFSILERIDVGETIRPGRSRGVEDPFSILERIDVGETASPAGQGLGVFLLSVSSNGSTWVKHHLFFLCNVIHDTFSILERIDVGETMRQRRPLVSLIHFQYPRTDRRG